MRVSRLVPESDSKETWSGINTIRSPNVWKMGDHLLLTEFQIDPTVIE
jgi:hypothetical protein